jgi:outer membrane putative beta-barrel porin/alpha-amylase
MNLQKYVLVVMATLVPTAATAQTANGLAHLVPDLILDGITLPEAGAPGNPHAGHFTLGNPTFGGSQAGSIPNAGAIGAVEAFNDRLQGQFANFPLGSSSGGFTYTYDEKLRTYTRRSASFGPAFTERALTIGRGQTSVGINFQHTSFDSFGGEKLNDRSIRFYLPHTDCCNAAAPPPSSLTPGFEGDLVEAALDLKATTDTFAFFANFGVTDRLDIGVAIPVTRVSMEANVRASIIRLSSGDTPLVHTFVQGQDVSVKEFSQSGDASGIGDIVVRTKYNFLTRGENGLAAALDLRLPTGDEDDLLGLGTTQGKAYLIWSQNRGRVSPHLNIGYTFSGKGHLDTSLVGFEPIGVSNEFNYAGGVEFVVGPQLTIIGDVIGRTFVDAGVVKAENKTFQFRRGAASPATTPLETSSTNPLDNQPYRQLTLTPGNLNLGLGAAGIKYNPVPRVLLSGNVLFPLSDAGLNDRLTFAFGVDIAF